MREFGRALRQAVVMYVVLGLVIVAFSAVAFEPPPGTTWQERATWAVGEIVTWPRVFPEAAAELDLRLPGLS